MTATSYGVSESWFLFFCKMRVRFASSASLATSGLRPNGGWHESVGHRVAAWGLGDGVGSALTGSLVFSMKCLFCPQRANQHCGQKERIFETERVPKPQRPGLARAVSGDVWARGFRPRRRGRREGPGCAEAQGPLGKALATKGPHCPEPSVPYHRPHPWGTLTPALCYISGPSVLRTNVEPQPPRAAGGGARPATRARGSELVQMQPAEGQEAGVPARGASPSCPWAPSVTTRVNRRHRRRALGHAPRAEQGEGPLGVTWGDLRRD